jgi:nucleoside-diphosphate-sugar epimerase
MDICDFDAFYKLMQDEKIDGIIHLAVRVMWTAASGSFTLLVPTSWVR